MNWLVSSGGKPPLLKLTGITDDMALRYIKANAAMSL